MAASAERPIVGRLEGSASDLLLVLWGRLPLATLSLQGDAAAIAAAVAAIDFD